MFTEVCAHGDSKVYQADSQGEASPSSFVVLGSPTPGYFKDSSHFDLGIVV